MILRFPGGIARLARGVLLCAAVPSLAAAQGDDPLGRAMRDELARSIRELRVAQFAPPYFIAYRVQEVGSLEASASYGNLLGSGESRGRTFDAEVRVGDYDFDNTNFFGGGGGIITINVGNGGRHMWFGAGMLPLDDDYLEIRRQIWLVTDMQYKWAVEMLAAKRAALLNRARSDSVPDFSREAVTRLTDQIAGTTPNRGDAEALVRALSGIREFAGLDASSVRLTVTSATTRYVNSEGSSYIRARPLITLLASASTQALDGQPLRGSVRWLARSADALPRREELVGGVRALALHLDSLRGAPLLERYSGPVLFEGQAAAELFAETFAPSLVARRRVEGGPPGFEMVLDRMGGGGDDESFTDRMGSRVLPEFLSVIDDPTLSSLGGQPLLGGYRVDDEGVPGRQKTLIENGILRTLLTTRAPVAGIPRSSGNRRGDGPAPSNILLQAANHVSQAALKRQLLTLVKKRGLPYGILVRELGSASTEMPDNPMEMLMALRDEGGGRKALLVYRVHPDGREELVRAGRLADVSPRSFRDVIGASSTPVVYHRGVATPGGLPARLMFMLEGSDGAMLPVASYVVPSLLFEDLVFMKPAGELPKPPLSRPPGER